MSKIVFVGNDGAEGKNIFHFSYFRYVFQLLNYVINDSILRLNFQVLCYLVNADIDSLLSRLLRVSIIVTINII